MRIDEVTFSSGSGHCVGVLYRPETGVARLPVIVMAHGISGTRLTQYDRRARLLLESGAAVLDFDNRFIGTSPGEPRQLINPKLWLEDLRSAVTHVRQLQGIDPDAVCLYGSSLGGATALAVAATDPRIRAIALDVPAIDGLRLTASPFLQQRSLLAAAARDMVARAKGKAPVTVTVFGELGSGAVVQNDTDGFWAAMEEIEGLTWKESKVYVTHPATGEWRNEATALELLNVPLFRPGRRSKDVTCPVLAHLSEDDKVVPYKATRKALQRARNTDIRTMRGGHFGPFYGDGFDNTVAAQVEFFGTTLR